MIRYVVYFHLNTPILIIEFNMDLDEHTIDVRLSLLWD